MAVRFSIQQTIIQIEKEGLIEPKNCSQKFWKKSGETHIITPIMKEKLTVEFWWYSHIG